MRSLPGLNNSAIQRKSKLTPLIFGSFLTVPYGPTWPKRRRNVKDGVTNPVPLDLLNKD